MSLQLSKDDHIFVGIGWLYAPPFLGRYLLYHLSDLGCSLLIYHSRERHASPVSVIGNVSSVEASREGPPTDAYVHCSSRSGAAALADLLELPPIRITLPGDTPVDTVIGDLAVRVESVRLPLTEKLIMACGPLPSVDLGIVGSAYCVAGPMQVSYWPVKIQDRGAKQRCWKVAICNQRNATRYDPNSDCDWSLTALDMEQGLIPECAVTLQRARSC